MFTPYIDSSGINTRLDVRRIVLLNHFNAGAAVLGDLVNVRPFHEAEADVGVLEAVGSARRKTPKSAKLRLP